MWRGANLVNMDNGKHHRIEGCTLVCNGIGFWIASTDLERAAITIRKTRVIWKHGALGGGNYVGVMARCRLEEVTFENESGVTPVTPWYVETAGAPTFHGQGVYMHNDIRWGSTAGTSGQSKSPW